MKRRTFLESIAAAGTLPPLPKAGAEKLPAAPAPSADVLPLLQNASMPSFAIVKGHLAAQRKPLVLLHFSDIHNDAANLRRLLAFRQTYKSFLDDTLLTGDIAGADWQDWSERMNEAPGMDGVLKTLGNHDIYKWNKTNANAMPAQCRERYFKGIDAWGVKAPAGDVCYWTKDYPVSGVRLIALDCMHWDAAQSAWFSAMLEEARAANLAVVAAQHIPLRSRKQVEPFDCAFNSLNIANMNDRAVNGEAAIAAVDAFQKAGGEFACWLLGHAHTDFCGVFAGTRQVYLVVGAAKNFELWGDCRRVAGEKSQDLFNVCAFDVFRKHIRVFRIGAEWNRYLQHRTTMCIDYAACKVLV